MRDSASNRAARVVLFFLLGSLPAFFLFGSIWRTAVNVPFMGDWQFVSLLERFSRTAREFSSTSAVESPASHGFAALEAGQDAGMRDSSRRVWENMDRLKDGGWHVSGYAVCRDDRPADLILFCTGSADGEWVVRTTAIPFSTSAQYLRNSARYDFEFLGSRPPQDAQLDAWEADFPPGVFGPENGGLFWLGRWISRGAITTIILKAILSFPSSRQ